VVNDPNMRFQFAMQLVGQRLQRQPGDDPAKLPDAKPVIAWAYETFDALVKGAEPPRVTPVTIMPNQFSPVTGRSRD